MSEMETSHILLIEDNPGDARLVELMLAESDINRFQVINVSTMADAIRSLSSNNYDAILLDMGLPDGNGMENIYRIKASVPHIPIVVMTGHHDEHFALNTVKAGVQDYLLKGSIDKWQLSRSLSYSIERKRLEDEMRHLAHHDPLTGLGNSALFRDRLQRAIARAQRRQEQIAVLYLDLDHFKSINDGLGHNMGDKLLQAVAERLQSSVRESDTVTRIGGDEFTIILDSVKNKHSVSSISEKIINMLSEPFDLSGHVMFTGTSIGIAMYPDSGITVDELIMNADSAMYRAKSGGRRQYKFYTEDMNAQALEQLEMENNLHQALENEEFVLHYQPKVNMGTGAVSGVEALLRWNHPKLGLVYPDRFIPVLENTGMIMEVGRWVLSTACRQSKLWHDQGVPAGQVAVNLSGIQLLQKDFGECVMHILENTDLAPEYLEVELTESMLIQNTDTCRKIIESLHGLGVSVAIDDFGTGYSSLTYLKNFQFDTLKIDQSFINNVVDNRTDAAITSAIISLSRELGINVVAEGVETQQQLNYLCRQGADEIQGYYISHPIPAEAISNLIGSGSYKSIIEKAKAA